MKGDPFVHMIVSNGIDVMTEAVKEDHKGLNGSCKRSAGPILVVKFVTPMGLDLRSSERAPDRSAQCHE